MTIKQELHLIYTTIDSMDEARRISKLLLQRKLIVCVNIIPQITAFYQWQDEFQEEQELIMIIKTVSDKIEIARDIIKSEHPYDCPIIADFCAYNINPEYLKWANESVGILLR